MSNIIINDFNSIRNILELNHKKIEYICIFKKSEKSNYLINIATLKKINIICFNKILNKNHRYIEKYINYFCKLNNDTEFMLENIDINKYKKILILYNLNDPYNISACLRSAEAFAVDLIVLNSIDKTKNYLSISRSSSGMNMILPILRINIEKFIDIMREKKFNIYAFSAKSKKPLSENILIKPMVLIMGSEKSGIPKKILEKCDHIYKISLHGKCNCINVSVATGIILSKTN
jgi:23S rRNA (guanosine2251-2'-O)-methyltransferase